MKRKVWIAIAVAGGLLVLSVGAAVLLIKPERLKDTALARIRESTGYRVEAGEASFKLGLGRVGIRVRDVEIVSPDSTQRLFVDGVDVLVKPLPLLRRQVELQRLVLHQPDYTVDDRERPPGETKDDAVALAVFAVEDWAIRDGRYRQRASWGELILGGLDVGGGFRWLPEQGGRGEAAGTVEGGWVRAGDGEWPLPTTEASMAFRVASTMDTLQLPEVTLQSGPLKILLKAHYTAQDGAWMGFLEGGAEAASLDSFKEWFPDSVQARMDEWMVSGTVAVPRLRIERRPEGSLTTGTIALERVFLLPPGLPIGIENASGQVHLEPDGAVLEGLTGSLGSDTFTAAGRLVLGDSPAYHLDLATTLGGETLGRLSALAAGTHIRDGSLTLDLEARGAPGPKEYPLLSGTARVQGLEGTWRDLPLGRGQAVVRFSGREAEITQAGARLGRSDFAIQGRVPDTRDPNMTFALTSDVLDLNELFPEAPDEGQEQAGMVALPGRGTVRIGLLRYRRAEASDVRGTLSLGRDGIRFDDIRASLYQGTVTGALVLRPVGDRPDWRYESDLRFQRVKAFPLVSAWELLGGVIDGDLSGEMNLHGLAGRDHPAQTFNAAGVLNLTDGALVNLPGLDALAEALQIQGAQRGRWPYRSLGMKVTVQEGRVLFDGVQMAQPGFDWDLGGSVGLDGRVSLKGTVRFEPERVTLPANLAPMARFLREKDGRIPVDFRIGGTTFEPVPTLDWVSVSKRAAERAKQNTLEGIRKRLPGGGS